MKTHILPLLPVAALLIAFTACTKEDQDRLNLEAELNMQYSDIQFAIDSGIPAGPTSVALTFNPAELNDVLAHNGYTIGQLKEFRITGAHVQNADAAAPSVYDAVQRLAIELGQNGSGYQMIAKVDPVPHGATELTLETSGIDLAQAMKADSVHLRASLVLGEAITHASNHLLKLNGKLVVTTAH